MAFRTNKTPVLQTKSASGSVATFNTALAMPLPSCNIAVNAWQEGSGDPSPSNVRPIHGFSVVNATRAGKNLCNESELIERKAVGEYGELVDNSGYKISPLIPIKNDVSLYLSSPNLNERTKGYFNAVMRFAFYDRNENFISRTSALSGTVVHTQAPINTCFVRFQCGYFAEDIQLEVGSEATAHEPYVTPTIYPIQLGQEVYGAEVDVDNGVAHVTHIKEVFNGDANISLTSTLTLSGTGFMIRSDIQFVYDTIEYISNYYMGVGPSAFINNMELGKFKIYKNDGRIVVVDSVNTVEELRAKYNSIPLEICYKLAEPFDIQLTPTQIKTLIGNNTIFADTGDVDLTYKDLDIAKRGNFREVFKLPS